jgi:hypothetical protein
MDNSVKKGVAGTTTVDGGSGDAVPHRDVQGRRWQYAYHEVDVAEMRQYILQWNDLGAAGWELVGCAPMSRTSHFGTPRWWGLGTSRPGTTNRMVYVFKRQIA